MSNKLTTLFICGIPGSGKSSFGKYLGDKHKYFYIDMEHDWPDEKLHDAWNKIFSSRTKQTEQSVKDFIDALNTKSRKIVLDLGFPPSNDYFRIIPLLKKYQFRVIWFECDKDIAKERWKHNKVCATQYFDNQANNIETNWNRIKDEINPEVIDVLNKDKSSKSTEEIYKEIFK